MLMHFASRTIDKGFAKVPIENLWTSMVKRLKFQDISPAASFSHDLQCCLPDHMISTQFAPEQPIRTLNSASLTSQLSGA